MILLVKNIMRNSIVRNIEANALTARIIPPSNVNTCAAPHKKNSNSAGPTFWENEIRIDDIYRLSELMQENKGYDCTLGLYSYTPVKEDEPISSDKTIIGIYHPVLPKRYHQKYSSLTDRSCIEIENDVLFLSPSDSTFENLGVEDGSTVYVKPTNALSLLGFCK